MEEEKVDNPFQIGEQVDCKDTVNQWLNAEIIAKRGQEVRVHYTQWSQKYDEWIAMEENRILKQWEFGQPIFINNRLDVNYIENKSNIWLEAIVRDIDQSDRNNVFIHFIGYKNKYDQWVNIQDDKRIADVGTHSKAHGKASLQKNNPKFQLSQKNFIEVLKNKENEFRNILNTTHSWSIHEVEPDGNCLFRSVSHQIYNVEDFHKEIRQVCMDYIQINQEYFRNFIIGGGRNFEDYVNWKRTDAVWGDNIEIQAIREIYERPVEIYAYSSEPMRTFSENSVNNQKPPIRLSYHGQSHYNSININTNQQQFQQQQQQQFHSQNVDQYEQSSQSQQEDNNALAVADSDSQYSYSHSQQQPVQPVPPSIQFGEIEQQALENAKERAQKKENKSQQDLEQARKDFDKIGNWDMDQAIKESLNLFNEKKEKNEFDLMEMAFTNDAINQVEQMIDDETDKTIQESRQQYEQEQIRLAQEQSKRLQDQREKDEQKKLQELMYEDQLEKAKLESNQEYDDQIKQVILASLNDFNPNPAKTTPTKSNNKYLEYSNFDNINNNLYSNENSNSNFGKSTNFILVGDPMENPTVLQVLNNDLNLDISIKEAVQAYEIYGENPQEILAYFCEQKL